MIEGVVQPFVDVGVWFVQGVAGALQHLLAGVIMKM